MAVLKDYDNEWDTWNKFFSAKSENAIFAAAQKSHTPLDYVYLYEEGTSEKLENYEVVFYPHGYMMSEKRAKILEEYVAQGGVLVLGCHSAFRNLYGHGVSEKLPGVLRNLTGIDIPEYTPVTPGDEKVLIRWGENYIEAACINDQLNIQDECKKTVRMLGTYENTYYRGTGGQSVNSFGKGKVYYWGLLLQKIL